MTRLSYPKLDCIIRTESSFLSLTFYHLLHTNWRLSFISQSPKMSGCSTASSVSSFLSYLSLVSWICAQLPQIYTNYSSKSAEGISPMFLLLWFMGDFLSFTSCLLSDVVLQFQVYLSLFFLCNDFTLCYQYYYYNSVYPRKYPTRSLEPETETVGVSHMAEYHTANSIHIRSHPEETQSLSQSDGSASSSYNSVDGKRQSFAKVATIGTMLNAGVSSAMALQPESELVFLSKSTLGLVLAWGCTVVYVSSRCPQLYKNYLRKSVDGVSPLLFGSALVGNITYTLSILTSCAFLYDSNKVDFFWRQLPYILGSSGTVVFDIAYFYQRHIYRNAGSYSNVVGLEPWDSIESGNTERGNR